MATLHLARLAVSSFDEWASASRTTRNMLGHSMNGWVDVFCMYTSVYDIIIQS